MSDRTAMRGRRGVWKSGASGQRIRSVCFASTRTERRQRGKAEGIKLAQGVTRGGGIGGRGYPGEDRDISEKSRSGR